MLKTKGGFLFVLFYFCLFIWLHWILVAACLVPWPGIKPRSPALGAWSLSHWTTREVSCMYLFKLQFYPYICPGVGWLDHMATLFSFLRNFYSVSIVAAPFTFPTTMFPFWGAGMLIVVITLGLPGGSVVKNTGLIPGVGRYPGEGNGNSFQCSCLGNLMDRGAWQVTVHGVAKEINF